MRISLSEVTVEDGSYIVNWRQSEKVKSHLIDNSEVTLESNEQFFKEYVLTGKYVQYMVNKAFENYPCLYPIATVYLKNIDKTNRRCELGLFPNSQEEWNDEAKTIALKMLIEKAFSTFGMKNVYAYVFADSNDEIALMKNAGFCEEGVLKNEVNRDDISRDVIRFGITR